MAQFLENDIPVISCNALLIQSIRIYREVGELYQSMHNQLSDTSIFKAQTTVESINSLLEDAHELDILIAGSFVTIASFSEVTQELLAKRAELLSQLHQANTGVAGRAKNAQSLLRHEITGMSTNRQAIKGYKPVETERRNMVQSFF